MELSPVMQKVQVFHKRHGEECYPDGYCFYYADGAYRDLNPMGVLAEPPDDSTTQGEWLLATNKLKFAEAKLKTAVDEFEQINERFQYWAPPDEDVVFAKLHTLQKEINQRKKLVAKAEEALKQTQWGQRKEQIRRDEEALRHRIAEFQQKRRAIKI